MLNWGRCVFPAPVHFPECFWWRNIAEVYVWKHWPSFGGWPSSWKEW